MTNNYGRFWQWSKTIWDGSGWYAYCLGKPPSIKTVNVSITEMGGNFERKYFVADSDILNWTCSRFLFRTAPWKNNLPTPLAGGQKKSFAEQMNFLSGVGMIFFDPVSNFQCATPRGLIRVPTVGCNLPQIAPLVDAILHRVAWPLPHSVLYQRKALGATFAMVHPAFSISRIFKPYFCIS